MWCAAWSDTCKTIFNLFRTGSYVLPWACRYIVYLVTSWADWDSFTSRLHNFLNSKFFVRCAAHPNPILGLEPFWFSSHHHFFLTLFNIYLSNFHTKNQFPALDISGIRFFAGFDGTNETFSLANLSHSQKYKILIALNIALGNATSSKLHMFDEVYKVTFQVN